MPTPIVIDLSHWNTIPSSLHPAKDAGIIGCIHKATEGASYKDDKCDARYALAIDAGMMFGLYHFLRAGVNITSQVNNFLSVYSRYANENILVALDYEMGSDGRTPSIDEVEDWLAQIEVETYKKPVIYSGNALKEAVGSKKHPQVNGDHYPLWLAQYTTGTPKLPTGWPKYWLWQYSDGESPVKQPAVPGVNAPCDVNAGNVDEVIAFWTGGEEPAPPVGTLDFSDAMRRVLDGERMRRAGWNGKGMWIMYHVPVGDITLPFICMSTVTGDLVPWLASQTDMCANDWEPA